MIGLVVAGVTVFVVVSAVFGGVAFVLFGGRLQLLFLLARGLLECTEVRAFLYLLECVCDGDVAEGRHLHDLRCDFAEGFDFSVQFAVQTIDADGSALNSHKYD